MHRSAGHTFSKTTEPSIDLVEGMGVRGDAHYGPTVQHRSRVAADPSQPNLRQVHLMHAELLAELAGAGFVVRPGELGENITTAGVPLLDLPVGTRLEIGHAAIIVTGLRNPCAQINGFQPGLLTQMLRRADDGAVERLAGVMGIVARSGTVRPVDAVSVVEPPAPHLPLTRV